MKKRQQLVNQNTQDQYMRKLIDAWQGQLIQYRQYANQASGDTATAFKDEMIRIRAKISQMKRRLSKMKQEYNNRSADQQASKVK